MTATAHKRFSRIAATGGGRLGTQALIQAIDSAGR
jgi:hypothetical protein